MKYSNTENCVIQRGSDPKNNKANERQRAPGFERIKTKIPTVLHDIAVRMIVGEIKENPDYQYQTEPDVCA